MGFVLSILYFVAYYLTPEVVFGPLAQFRVELILAVLIFLVSLLSLGKSFALKTPQAPALLGLSFAVMMSVLVGEQWAGGALKEFLLLIPNVLGYFLVCLYFNTKKRLQALIVMMMFACVFVIAHGGLDIYRGGSGFGPIQSIGDERVDSWNGNVWKEQHPYVIFQAAEGAKSWIFRLRGLGEINDPNDFGQLTVCVIPLVFIFWRPKKMLWNTTFVLLPVSVLITGIYLTKSRGALVALVAMAVVAARRRIGTVPALLVAGGMFAAAMALHFTGGREINAEAGADRTTLWGLGLELLKSHPFFGVGLNNMKGYSGLTAHNSLVVCGAELGFFGLFFWSMFLFTTMRDALAIASPVKVSEGDLIVAEEEVFPQMTKKIEVVDKAEINRLGRLVVLSLTGFLVAAWFLSRSFVLTLYLLGGIAEVVYEMALQRGMIGPRLRLSQLLPYAGGLAIAMILLMYILLRTVNLMH
jgi:hypothetical protein